MVRKYEGEHSLSAIVRGLDSAVPTVNTTEKDAGRITEHVKGKSTMKSTRLKKTNVQKVRCKNS
jgi:hypothetical protein